MSAIRIIPKMESVICNRNKLMGVFYKVLFVWLSVRLPCLFVCCQLVFFPVIF